MDVLIDLHLINEVRLEQRDGKHWVTVGGGCQIKHLLAQLTRQNAGTLPALGLVTEQSIAGAISTATHGSGHCSMSQFIEELRVVTYDAESGEPVVRTIKADDELRAGRCSLGALGIICSVSFWARRPYFVEEHFRRYDNLGDVIAAEEKYPLQQFYLLPWRWQYFAQHRREVKSRGSALVFFYRAYFFLAFDIGLHLIILLLVRALRSSRAVRFFYKSIVQWTVIQGWPVIGRSQTMLTMEHELFQHVECEMFVRRSRLIDAVGLSITLLKCFGGDRTAVNAQCREALGALGILPELDRYCGSYTHHYPICIRLVLPDDSLISMSSGGNEPFYALSFISYARPSDRQGFMDFARILSKAMGALFDGRPHWGKICPLSAEGAARLYPQLPRFREIAAQFDPNGVFRNDWMNTVLFD
jgi:hypothetical protein